MSGGLGVGEDWLLLKMWGGGEWGGEKRGLRGGEGEGWCGGEESGWCGLGWNLQRGGLGGGMGDGGKRSGVGVGDGASGKPEESLCAGVGAGIGGRGGVSHGGACEMGC